MSGVPAVWEPLLGSMTVDQVRLLRAAVLAEVRAGTMIDGAKVARLVRSDLVGKFNLDASDKRLQSDDGLDRDAECNLVGDGTVGGKFVEHRAADDEVLRQVGSDSEHFEHGDSSSVGPDAATSGGAPTVEGGGDTPDDVGDSSVGRVTDNDDGPDGGSPQAPRSRS